MLPPRSPNFPVRLRGSNPNFPVRLPPSNPTFPIRVDTTTIKNAHKQRVALTSRRDYALSHAHVVEEVRNIEKKALNELQYHQCHIPSTVRDFGTENMRSIIREKYMDAEAFSIITCLLTRELYTSGSSDTIRSYIRKMRRIGSGSAYGIAMAADFQDLNDAFVIKVSRFIQDRQADFDDIRHEAVVGFNVLNKARKLDPPCPNFAYVWTAINMNPPHIRDTTLPTESKSMEGSPRSKQKAALAYGMPTAPRELEVTHVVYENIADSKSLSESIATASLEDILGYYLQCLLAVETIHEETGGFHHGDLHSQNVILRPHGITGTKDAIIEYRVNGRDYRLATDRIATIIDFGMVHARLPDGKRVYPTEDVNFEYGLGFTHAFPVYDAYKLLLNIARDAHDSGREDVLNACALIYRFWSDEPLTDAILGQRSTYYSLILPPGFAITERDRSLLPVIQYVTTVLSGRLKLEPEESLPVISCSGRSDKCLTGSYEEKLAKFGYSDPDNFIAAVDDFRNLTGGHINFLSETNFRGLYVKYAEGLLKELHEVFEAYAILVPSFMASRNSNLILGAFLDYSFQILDIITSIDSSERAIEELNTAYRRYFTGRDAVSPFSDLAVRERLLRNRSEAREYLDEVHKFLTDETASLDEYNLQELNYLSRLMDGI